MSTYYLSAELSRYIDARGGKDFLIELVTRERAADEPESPAVNEGGGLTYRQPGDYLGTHEILRRS